MIMVALSSTPSSGRWRHDGSMAYVSLRVRTVTMTFCSSSHVARTELLSSSPEININHLLLDVLPGHKIKCHFFTEFCVVV